MILIDLEPSKAVQEFIEKYLKNHKKIGKFRNKFLLWRIDLIILFLDRKEFHKAKEEFMTKEGMEEFPEANGYNGSRITKNFKCENPPEILCIHLNRIPDLQQEGANFKKIIDFGEMLEFPNNSKEEGNNEFLNNYPYGKQLYRNIIITLTKVFHLIDDHINFRLHSLILYI